MGRPRRQEHKRSLLVSAALRVLERDGIQGLRVREVAAEAEVSPASVLYYYPDSFQLAVQAFDVAVKSLGSERAAVAASVPDPAERLNALIDIDLADPPPGATRAIAEAPLLTDEHPELLPVLEAMCADETDIYVAVIDDGLRNGTFTLTGGANSVQAAAQSLVMILHASRSLRVAGLQTADEARRVVRGAITTMLYPPVVEVASLDHEAQPIPRTGPAPVRH